MGGYDNAREDVQGPFLSVLFLLEPTAWDAYLSSSYVHPAALSCHSGFLHLVSGVDGAASYSHHLERMLDG